MSYPDFLFQHYPSCFSLPHLLVYNVILFSSVDTEQELDPAYIAGFACLGVGLSLILLGALVCIFYYQRNRIGHYNFAAKPKQENFTYLVFNA